MLKRSVLSAGLLLLAIVAYVMSFGFQNTPPILYKSNCVYFPEYGCIELLLRQFVGGFMRSSDQLRYLTDMFVYSPKYIYILFML